MMAEFHLHKDLSTVLDGLCLIAVGIGPAHEAMLLAVNLDDAAVGFERTAQPGWAEYPRLAPFHPHPATVIRIDDASTTQIALPAVDARFPMVQPLADGQMVIADPRCGPTSQNAVVYDSQGRETRRMRFGDGIEAMQVARDGCIWVSYFDEGVYGKSRMGADGLLCFDTNGQITWHFHAPDGFERIDTCYALNVAYDAVWACYYPGFPLIHISSDGNIQGRVNLFSGPRAIAVDYHRVLLWGGYRSHGEQSRCVVQTIAGEHLVSPQHLDLRLPDGIPLDGARVIGRNSILHAFVGTSWYQFDLRDLPVNLKF